MKQLTLRDARDVIREELGRDPAKGTVEALVNEAGERWVNAENWRYLRHRTKEITLEPGVEDYPLGAGIQSIGRVLHRPDTVWAPLELLEFSAFTAHRERFLGGLERPFNPVATTVWDAKATDTGRTLYLRIFPTGIGERIVVEYRGGWLPLDELDDAADLPPPLVVHFRDWLRVYAMHREFPEQYPMGTLDAFMQSSSFVDAQRQDAETAGRIAVRKGAIGEHYGAMKSWGSDYRYEAMRHYYERGFGR
jgi:hypothetical protein